MRNSLLATTAICGLVFFAATPAFAACSSANPSIFDTVSCNDADTTGVSTSDPLVTVNVGSTGSISTNGPAINLGDVNTANIDGTVTSATDDGIRTGGISAVTVNNGGSVTGALNGVNLGGSSTLTINAGGSVTGNTGAYFFTNSGSPSYLTVLGTLIGTGGTAAIIDGNTPGIFTLGSAATITGNVIGGNTGSDEFHFQDNTGVSFNTDDIGAAAKYQNFDLFFKDGTGTTTLTDTNALDWNITAGKLTGNYANLGNIAISSGATLGLTDTASNHTYSGTISGAGDVVKEGSGALTMSGTNTNSGKVIINDGALLVSSSDNLGDGSATNNLVFDGGALTYLSSFDQTRDITMTGNGTIDTNGFDTELSGTISGAGDVIKSGSGILTLTGTNTYGGSTTINDGTIVVSADNNLGTGGITFNGGTLQLNASFDTAKTVTLTANGGTIDTNGFESDFSGNISGATGTLTKTGAAKLTLSGTNSFGGLTVNEGLVAASSQAALGTGPINLNLGGLVFDNDFSISNDINLSGGSAFYTGNTTNTLSGVISGSGLLISGGGGTLILTNTQTFTGSINQIVGSTLIVNGDFSSMSGINIYNYATLGGTGTVSNAELFSGATLAPGNSIGTLNVNGTLAFNSGSHYAVEYDNTSADKTIATGAVTIDSGAILDLTGSGSAGTFAPSQTYTILQGSSVTGTFGTVNNNLAFLAATQNNTGTTLDITLARNNTSFSDVAKNATQTNTAGALSNLAAGNALFDAFTGISTTQAANALQSMSGSGVVGVVPNTTPTFIQPVMSHIAFSSGTMANIQIASANTNTDPTVYTAALMEPAAGSVNRDIDAWFQAIGGFGHTLSDAQSPGQKRNNYGAVAGLDRNLDSIDGRMGIFGGWQFSDFSANTISASSEVNSYQLGGYVQRTLGKFTVTGGASAMYHDIDTVRHVIVGGSSFSPHGNTNGNTLTAFGELSHPLALGDDLALEGFGAFSVTRNRTDGYTETNGGAANLTVGDVTKTNPATTIGIRGGKHVGQAMVTGSLGWQHTFGDTDNDATMRFAGGGTEFTSTGTPIAKDAAIVSINATGDVWSGAKAYVGYDGTLATDAQDHGFKAGLKIAF